MFTASTLVRECMSRRAALDRDGALRAADREDFGGRWDQVVPIRASHTAGMMIFTAEAFRTLAQLPVLKVVA